MFAWLDGRICYIAPADVKLCVDADRDQKTCCASMVLKSIHLWLCPSDPKLHTRAALMPTDVFKRLGVLCQICLGGSLSTDSSQPTWPRALPKR